MKAKNNKLTLPSVLSFERKLEVSDALMQAGIWAQIDNKENWQDIQITKRMNRSTQSSYGIDDLKKSEPNPVASNSDDANLPMTCDTLRVNFSLRIIGDLGKPFSCNSPPFQSKLIEKVREFKNSKNGLNELAFRYAYNIVNGRFLWRNRVCAECVKIKVYLGNENEALVFNALEYSISDFEQNKKSKELQKLSDYIFNGLKGDDNKFFFLTVEAYAKIGFGQHIFPSQEMNMNEKGKILFNLDGCAAIHNVKIGNAIRTIDNWYDAAEFPIAVEPFGAVTQIGQAFRKSKNDLYTLIEKWVCDEAIEENEVNFIIANLIRGGLFQGKNKENKKGKSEVEA